MNLAKDCPNFEKAFSNATLGKMLGIFFYTKTLSWSLPKEKIEKTLSIIHAIESKNTICLLEMRQLMGSLNHIGQMCPFLLNFRFNLNLVQALCNKNPQVTLPDEALKGLSHEIFTVIFWL